MTMSAELYQQVILEHNKKPKNFHKLEPATHAAEGFNPLCGDHLWVYLRIAANGTIDEVAFEGAGCAISKASASMMTVALKGKTVDEARALFKEFHALLLGELKPDEDPNQLGKLKIFFRDLAVPFASEVRGPVVACNERGFEQLAKCFHGVRYGR